MSFLEKSIMIKKPIEDVFQAATDFSNSPEIMDAVVGVELLTEGPVREGYEFKETREIRGRKVSSKIVVTDFEKINPTLSEVFNKVLICVIIIHSPRRQRAHVSTLKGNCSPRA